MKSEKEREPLQPVRFQMWSHNSEVTEMDIKPGPRLWLPVNDPAPDLDPSLINDVFLLYVLCGGRFLHIAFFLFAVTHPFAYHSANTY